MSVYDSDLDDDRLDADSFADDHDPSEWGNVAELAPEFGDDLPEWDDIVPDLEVEYSDLYCKPFDSTGSEGESIYHFDS